MNISKYVVNAVQFILLMSSPTYKAYDKFTIEKPFVSIFVAPRKSGKTYLINKLLRHVWFNQFDYVVIASPSLEFTDDYPDELSAKTKVIKISDNFHAILSQIIAEQKRSAKLHKEDSDEYDEVHTLMILDDLIDNDILRFNARDNLVDEIAERGRHYKISLVVSAQILSKVSVSMRRNAEALFFFAPLNYTDFERILQEFVPLEYRRQLRDKLHETYKEEFAFLLFDGSPARRVNFKLRLRKGFTELLFSLNPQDETFEPSFINDQKANGKPQLLHESKQNDVTNLKIPETSTSKRKTQGPYFKPSTLYNRKKHADPQRQS